MDYTAITDEANVKNAYDAIKDATSGGEDAFWDEDLELGVVYGRSATRLPNCPRYTPDYER